MTIKVLHNSAIPQFALYGETAFSHKPEFIHLEDIHERSSRNGWVIKPHRHSHLYQILCMFSGEAEVHLDDSKFTHRGSWVVTLPSGVVHGFRFSPDTQGVVLSLAVGMLGLDAENQVGQLLEGVLSRPRIVRFRQEAVLFRQLREYLALIRQELSDPREDQDAALFALIKLVLMTLKRRVREDEIDEVAPDKGMMLTNKFRKLLEKQYKNHWKIADYAAELHVSVSTLNRACHDILGSSAKKLIQERLHIEAKRRLIYTRETLDQISFDLGFKDAAYFSRVFKRREGLSPKHFRQDAARI